MVDCSKPSPNITILGASATATARSPKIFSFARRNLAQDLAVELDNALSARREGIGSGRCAESLIVRERHCRGRPAWFHRL
jgi:hypothetical protein